MKYASKLLSAAGTAALMTLAANPAHAAGTTAGSTITNTVAVNFQVGGVTQTAATAANSIIVDEKVVFTNVEQGATTSVSPGQTNAVTTFKITNSSNATIDVGLAATAQANGASPASGTGTVNQTATGYTYWLDTSGTGVYNASTVTQVTYLDQLAAGASDTVFVLANIPASATSGQIAGVDLVATAESGATPGTQGAVLASSTGAWTPGTMQIVLADGIGTGSNSASDINYDGRYSALGEYLVAAPMLSIYKNSTIVTDPVDGSSNPKSIPGATMQYCIVVSNASTATASASNINIADVLPANITYKASSTYINTTVSGSGATATCSGGTASPDSTAYSATGFTGTGATAGFPSGPNGLPSTTPTVVGTVAGSTPLAAGQSIGLLFQVTIN